MSRQGEHLLEKSLMTILMGMDYEFVIINDEADMRANLKQQIEMHNEIALSGEEFTQILHHLNRGVVYDRAQILRDRYILRYGRGERYIRFLNIDKWSMNRFQVAQRQQGTQKDQSRYGVTILINGLPLVQIELKRHDLELKEAFYQVQRYKNYPYDAGFGLFSYVQLFVISNGTDTKYFTNNSRARETGFEQTFYWTDSQNNRYTDLAAFTETFLQPSFLAKMITQYVMLGTDGVMRILRPYQYYAVEKIIRHVENSDDNAYIWHSPGSGKTLTSFKASQIIQNMPKVHKVLFVVDRADLDINKIREFNSFSADSVDQTKSPYTLISKLTDKGCRLIVTTIQKLNHAMTKSYFQAQTASLAQQKMVFIFDDCHRSQLNIMRRYIRHFFKNSQMIGFTGTPVFVADSDLDNKLLFTTKDLFGECLHCYTITDAIRDGNVLPFSVEYIDHYGQGIGAENAGTDIEGTGSGALFEDDERINKIVSYILQHHRQKTHQCHFTSIFCVSSVKMLIKYYEAFRQQQQDIPAKSRLKIATIFTYAADEVDAQEVENGFFADESIEVPTTANIDTAVRDKLDEFIAEYNARYGTSFNCRDNASFDSYYRNIAEKVHWHDKLEADERIDILLVANVFLTGFDSPPLNTLYIDKNLRSHSLIQAFSRTNRLCGTLKTHGNIVCFRHLQEAVGDAIATFFSENGPADFLLKPYEHYRTQYNQAAGRLRAIAVNPDAVEELLEKDEALEFVRGFRELLRLHAVLSTFTDYQADDFSVGAQDFEAYKNKYLGIYHSVEKKRRAGQVSALAEVDFELELIQRDEITVRYILQLLQDFSALLPEQQQKRQKQVEDLLTNQVQLSSKRELIEEFIGEIVPHLAPQDSIEERFDAFMEEKAHQAIMVLCREEALQPEETEKLFKDCIFLERQPRQQEVRNILIQPPKLLESRKVIPRIIQKMAELVEKFS